MAEMEFKYTTQQYQTDAVNSVVRVFAGQPYNDIIVWMWETILV
jgi:type III restriction enzyme